MAENKKSFVAYSDWKETFDKLPDEIAGKLIKHIFAYVNDENPISNDYVIDAVFANIKHTLKRDLLKWEKQLLQRRDAGLKSAEQRALTKLNERSISLNETQRNSTVSVNDSVNVNKPTTITYNIEKAIEICLRDLEWIASASKTCDLKTEYFSIALKDFKENCISMGKNEERTIQDFKYHFVNWVKKKKDIKAKETVKDRL